MNPADRKKQLIAQGAVYRAELILARQATQASLRPDSLASGVIRQIALTAFSAFRNRNGAGGLPGVNVQTLLPLVMGGISALSKRKPRLKTILRGAVIAGLVAGGVALVSRKKRASGKTAGDSL